MESYDLLLFLHVTSVIVWLGAGATIDLLFLRAERTGDLREVGKTAELQEWLVPRVFIPAGVATLVFGILVALDGPWSFDALWILIGLAGWVGSFGVGFLYLRPEGEKLKEIVAAHGPASPEARRHAKRLGVVARVQLLGLFLVVADMVLKPTTDDLWTLVLLAAVLAAAALAGALSLRRPEGEVPEAPAAQ